MVDFKSRKMLLWQPKKFWYADRAKKNENGNGQKGKKNIGNQKGKLFSSLGWVGKRVGKGWVSFAQMSRAKFFAVLSFARMTSAQW